MSRFFSGRHAALTAYVPGEQPKGQPFIKLNTNEAPFPPPPEVTAALGGAAKTLNLYSDPEGAKLREKLAGLHGVTPKNISLGNGSDETLAFIFLAFFDGVIFPDVTYGLYPVTASLFNIPYTEIPVDGALAVNVSDYLNAGKNIV
ncbi:MAG: histidinol-phosphate transaminase, partial [Oscillospiraceae bacterium]|nr:histidinol-phosphate transaminase [Oscillospiraceae bacterium]